MPVALFSATFWNWMVGSVCPPAVPVVKLIEKGTIAPPAVSFTPEVTTKVYWVLGVSPLATSRCVPSRMISDPSRTA